MRKFDDAFMNGLVLGTIISLALLAAMLLISMFHILFVK